MSPDLEGPRRTAPSAARNREPILAVLRDHLTRPGLLLEIASGSGEHALWFSTALPHITWQPTDPEPAARTSIEAWREDAGPNLLPPIHLDAAAPIWPITQADAILSINMIHIAPWSAAQGLMAGAARTLRPGGHLILYGPFRKGPATTPGNADFDANLRSRNPDWGVRELNEVIDLAETSGLRLAEQVAMPAGNDTLIFNCT